MRICFVLIPVFYFFSSCNNEMEVKNSPKVTDNYYKEQHRPQFHFSPEEKWMNDPNGMFFYEGEYHLFYQYYPDSTVWGPMHWGHAISTDLVHWEHLPIALYPDSLGNIFSGSAVVDWKNTSGLGQAGKPPLVAIFTHHLMEGEKAGRNDFQYQSIAFSNDKGRTWTKYKGNPVIPNTENIRDFRDPKVIWENSSEQWIMVFAAYDHIKFWSSKDLKKWEHLSDWGREFGEHGGVWECPDLFPLKIEGSDEKKWVLIVSINPGSPNGGSGTQYFIGDFNGKDFKLDENFAVLVKNGNSIWLDYGRDNYAGVTWSDIPKEDGRRLFLGWMSNWNYAQVVPTEKWRSAMTIPRELVLKNTTEGIRLISKPVEEMKVLRKDSFDISSTNFNQKLELLENFKTEKPLLEIVLEVEKEPDLYFGVAISNQDNESYEVGYREKSNQYFSNRNSSGKIDFATNFATKEHYAPRNSGSETIKLQLFIDVASTELIADDGATLMTDIFFPKKDYSIIEFFTNKEAKIKTAKLYTLQSIWTQ